MRKKRKRKTDLKNYRWRKDIGKQEERKRNGGKENR
jgi:hypothetical protein